MRSTPLSSLPAQSALLSGPGAATVTIARHLFSACLLVCLPNILRAAFSRRIPLPTVSLAASCLSCYYLLDPWMTALGELRRLGQPV